MTHLATALFFIMIFIGTGVALQLMVKEYWQEIMAALRLEVPVRRIEPARFTVTLRPRHAAAFAPRRRGAAF